MPSPRSALLAAVALAGVPPAGAEGRVNHVIVVNQADSRAAADGRAVVAADGGATVDPENVALARAHCTDCRTVSVAVQVVTVEGSVSDFRPLNAAVAVNEECTRCQTYAYARQEIIAVDAGFELTDAGRDEVRRLEDAIEAVAASDEAFLAMGAELDQLVAQLRDAIRAEIGRAGRHEQGHAVHRQVDERV